ncbi:hypothetical protein [Mycoplasma sp. P36-A1]|uniref:hypothetical protein n=1 Tax=Mycoplasma sp. P36-A1 TaxID=3252900 RepID=UPI003C2E3C3C
MNLIILTVILYAILLIAFTLIPTSWLTISIFAILSILLYTILSNYAEKKRNDEAIYLKNNQQLLDQNKFDESMFATYQIKSTNNFQVDINNVVKHNRPVDKKPFNGLSSEDMKKNLYYQRIRLYEFNQSLYITDLMLKYNGSGVFQTSQLSIYGLSKFGYLKMGYLNKEDSEEIMKNYNKIIFFGVKFKYGKYKYIKPNELNQLTAYSDYHPYELSLQVVYKD